MSITDYGTGEPKSHLGVGSDGKHCHNYLKKSKEVKNKAKNKLIWAMVVCLFFILALVVGGYLANSLSIAADAAHMLVDLISFLISIFSITLSTRPATKKLTYGWHRMEILGALASILLLLLITGIVDYLAVLRIISMDFEININPMIVTASVGLVLNIILGVVLHDFGHNHSHGHSHGDTHGHSHGHTHGHSHSPEKNKLVESPNDENEDHSQKEENINVRAAVIHVIGDFISSIALLTAAIILYFKPGWKIADPICTLCFSFLIFISSTKILMDIISILMESKPSKISYDDVTKTLNSVKGVKAVHNLHLWSISLDVTALSVHVVKDHEVVSEEVLQRSLDILHNKFKIQECTIQVEDYTLAMDDCDNCKLLN